MDAREILTEGAAPEARGALPALPPEACAELLERFRGCPDFAEFGRLVLERAVNGLLSAAADAACGAPMGKRDPEGRENTRNGYRDRSLNTSLGKLALRIPKLREGSFFPEEILTRWCRTDAALAAAVAEMYVCGVSTRKVEAVARAMGLESLSRSQVSDLCASLDGDVEAFMSRPLGPCYYLWLDATYVPVRESGRAESRAVVTAIGVGPSGGKEFLGMSVFDTETEAGWSEFLGSLVSRGLSDVQLVVSDAHRGLVAAIASRLQGASWQRCVTHLMRNVGSHLSRKSDQARAVELMRAAFAQADPLLAGAVYRRACDEVCAMSDAAGRCMADAEGSALAFMQFPREHWPKIRTNNVQERANAEIKRRTRVVGTFPTTASLVRLVGAVLAEESESWSRYHMFSEASAARALDRLPRREPSRDELRDIGARAEAIVRAALDRADARK